MIVISGNDLELIKSMANTVKFYEWGVLMNKKVIILILLCTSFFAIGCVGAADLKNYDFDGYFTMNVPNDVSFEKQINDTSQDGYDIVNANYMSENIVIVYMNNPMLGDNSSVYLYQTMLEQGNPDVSQCYESQEGNLTIFESTAPDGSDLSLVGTCSGNKLVIIVGDDVGLIKEMGNSVKFN